jgi:Peptidogalycan biosysnthesis/recognition
MPNYTILDQLNDADIQWLISIDETKARHIIEILSEKNEACYLIKISEGNTTLLYFILEIRSINLSKLCKVNNSIVSRIGTNLLKLGKLKLAMPNYSILYDFDFCIKIKQINEADKLQLIAECIEALSSKLDFNLSIISITNSSLYETNRFDYQSYSLLQNDIKMQLAIDPYWNSFNDYLNTLKKKYKKRALEIRKKGAELLFVELSQEDLSKNSQEIYSLYQQVIANQRFVTGVASSDHFKKLKKLFGQNYQLETIYLQEKLVGFVSYFIIDKSMKVHFIGIDYSYNHSHDLYFNILFRVLEIAILQKFKMIDYGRTSLDAKASLGATPIYQNTYLKTFGITNIIKNQLIRQIESFESGSWKIRLPFKPVVNFEKEKVASD